MGTLINWSVLDKMSIRKNDAIHSPKKGTENALEWIAIGVDRTHVSFVPVRLSLAE
jgi:hypothetical protein